MICKVMESAHVKKQDIVIFSFHIFHTLRPHTLPRERVKMRWACCVAFGINFKHSQDCVGLASSFCPWAGGGPERSCNRWVHCSHPWTAQDPDANRWFGFTHPGNEISTSRYPWLGHPSPWPLRSTSFWHWPNRVGLSNDLHSLKIWSFQEFPILCQSISTSQLTTLSSRTLLLLR